MTCLLFRNPQPYDINISYQLVDGSQATLGGPLSATRNIPYGKEILLTADLREPPVPTVNIIRDISVDLLSGARFAVQIDDILYGYHFQYGQICQFFREGENPYIKITKSDARAITVESVDRVNSHTVTIYSLTYLGAFETDPLGLAEVDEANATIRFALLPAD